MELSSHILDEPTNALDTLGIKMAADIIKKMKNKERLIVIASHEIEFLKDVADVVYEIENGRIIQAGEPDDSN